MDGRHAPTFFASTRRIGWLPISSGIFGLVGIGFLVAAVTTRTAWLLTGRVYLLFRAHDIVVVLQYLLLIPFALELKKLRLSDRTASSSGAIAWGIGAISFAALFLILGATKVVNDMFYMLPQGVFGAWLIVMNWRLSGLLPRWLRAFGVVVGLGLMLVGIVFPGLATFVYPSMWKIPAVPVDEDTLVQSGLNRALHLVLAIGSVLGVVTLPFWSTLVGSKLLARRSGIRDTA